MKERGGGAGGGVEGGVIYSKYLFCVTASVMYHKINVACHNEMRDPYYDRYCKRDACGNDVNCEVCCKRML